MAPPSFQQQAGGHTLLWKPGETEREADTPLSRSPLPLSHTSQEVLEIPTDINPPETVSELEALEKSRDPWRPTRVDRGPDASLGATLMISNGALPVSCVGVASSTAHPSGFTC